MAKNRKISQKAKNLYRRRNMTGNVVNTLGALAGGAIVGAVLGRGSLLAGGAALIYGVATSNTLATVAGAAAIVAPGQLSSDEKSASGGVKGIIANAKASVKKLGQNTYAKTYLDKVAPNLLPSMAIGELGEVNYYPSLAEQQFNGAMGQLNAYDDDNVSGYLPEMTGDMGRVEGDYQAMEAAGAMGNLGDFQDIAAETASRW